ncbi:carboxypeptidase-like regulatory domain-containing protein [Mucilaginibacter polytrichastri]|uniref:Carboxypeptidase-like regulatory domain-containing protein n=2 Tax=Mucilaginibacter polytrichastri TaxID=1302689 RepID=A0A1Q6A1N8_9SPHI|nr:carboxypeptidase-like regulatory domain-containing protein [Mucilaginibacter polytrichastri]OKS87930.1 hypothetical protein RG47T_3394 [Mucilaginibacter polytrichastri]
MLASHQLYAQTVTGLVIERSTMLPVSGATVTAQNYKGYTGYNGYFKIARVNAGDTIKIVYAGFKPYRFSYRPKNKPDTVKIMLEPVSLMLNEVSVRASRNINLDSVKNRDQFKAVFNHKYKGLQDIFISNARVNKFIPYDNITAPNSTTTILSVNLLQVAGLITQKKSKVSKLQQTLIADEQFNYAGQRFSRQKITAITGLKGDSLQKFTEKCQLGLGNTQSMTDYDIMVYIKKSYADFVKR